MFSTPHELNFKLSMNTLEKKHEKECVKAVLCILEYSLYSKLSCCIRFIQSHPQSRSSVLSFMGLAHERDEGKEKHDR